EAQQTEDAKTTVPMLTGMLAELVGQDLDPRQSGYVQLLEEIARTGGQAGAAAKYVLENLDALEADLGGQSPAAVQYRGKRALEQARQNLNPELPSDGSVTLEQSQAGVATANLLDRVFNQPQTIGGKLTAALLATVSDAFTDLGTEGREAFWARFEELATDPEVGDMGANLARFLLGRLTDAPEFDTLRAKLVARLDLESQGHADQARSAIEAADGLAEKDVDSALDTLNGTLTDLWAAADRGEDAAEGINLVTEAINRLTAAREAGEQAGLDDLLTGGNTRFGADAVKAADDLAGQGQYSEALDVLEGTLTDLYAAAENGEDAAEAINAVTDAINRLTQARDAANAKTAADNAVITADVLSKLAQSQRDLNEAMGQSGDPYAAQLQGLEALKATAPELAGEIDALIVKWKKLQGETVQKKGLSEWADMAGQIGAGLSTIGNSLGGDVGANIAGLGKALQLGADVAKDLISGNYIGAAIKVVTGLVDAIAGFQKAYQQADKMREDFNKRFTLIRGDDYAKTFVRSRGWLADTFGGGPEVKQELDEFGLKIAQAIESGVLGGIKNGMKQALMTGDWSNFSNTFRESAYSGVVDGLIEAIFNDALKEILAPGIKALTDAAKTDSTADDDAAISEFERGLGRAEQFITGAGQRLQPGLDRLRDNLGVKVDPSMTRGVDTTGLSTLPEPIQFALATPLLEGVWGLREAAEAQRQAAAIQKEAAELVRDTFKGGIRVTTESTGGYRSTTGTLV
ncbi:hypothetical protein, partial [Deinococcus arboris]|uniref:hypothetical protein n=1 Tax=Deinococcus arboris TaxID=2682977 RepID=UPI0018DC86A8